MGRQNLPTQTRRRGHPHRQRTPPHRTSRARRRKAPHGQIPQRPGRHRHASLDGRGRKGHTQGHREPPHRRRRVRAHQYTRAYRRIHASSTGAADSLLALAHVAHGAPHAGRRAASLRHTAYRPLPLGSGALAGNAFGIDRAFLAKELGFKGGVTSNSIDATCDRDFVVEVLMWATLTLTHLSQLAEDLIIMNLIKGVVIHDAYATGSSLMPQKKNPDALELLRGKAAVVLGRAVGFTATLKGLPRAYNKDLQEDKVPLFETVDTVKDCLHIAAGVIATLTLKEDGLKKSLCPEMLATDLADYLVRRGVPFRETHHISGACVRLSEETNVSIDTLTLEQLQEIDSRFEADVMEVWDYEASVERKSSLGGTAKAMVQKQIDDCLAFAKTL